MTKFLPRSIGNKTLHLFSLPPFASDNQSVTQLVLPTSKHLHDFRLYIVIQYFSKSLDYFAIIMTYKSYTHLDFPHHQTQVKTEVCFNSTNMFKDGM